MAPNRRRIAAADNVPNKGRRVHSFRNVTAEDVDAARCHGSVTVVARLAHGAWAPRFI